MAGLAGPRAQLAAARARLGTADAAVRLDHRALLFALALDELAVPEPLAAGRVTCGPPRGGERSTLVSWRMAYALETLGQERTPSLRDSSTREIDQLTSEGAAFVLREGRRPVAFSAFNARVPDTVQVGGVYTPKERRGHGFGRAVVAGSLLLARAEGVRRAVLFTEEENAAARRAYEALGFRVVGDYGMVLFR